MLIKLLSILLISSVITTDSAKLRKIPKVYNALITTDEELTPSKAYPLIQPVLQPIPLFSSLYPVSYADQFEPNKGSINSDNNNNNEDKSELKDVEAANPQEVNNAAEKVEKPNSPIPLNEFGLPPSLIPLRNYPYNLPFYYDSYGNYQAIQYPVLPPIDFFNVQQQDRKLPPLEAPMFEVKGGGRNLNEPTEEKNVEQSISPISNDSIKNYANKNSEIPDVEIPPLPVKY